jgi:phage terminase large subunit-like protein
MRDAAPDLADIRHTVNNLSYGLGFFRPFSRDQGIKSGPRPHMALIDEVHEHPSAEVINKLRAGFKFRKQPLAIEITNSGFDRTSICWQHRQHAENILRGVVVDDRQFAYVCALDDGDEPLIDPMCWIKANPMLGVTITREYLERQVENAKNIASEMKTVLRLNFCVWTHAEQRAIDPAQWAACQEPPDDGELAGQPCFGGLDLGQTDDFSAFAIVWDMEDGRYVSKVWFWITQDAAKTYAGANWIDAPSVNVTTGDPHTVNYDEIQEGVGALCAQWGVREVAYDKRFAEQMAQHLVGRGITMVDTPQGMRLNEAIRELLKAIGAGDFCHGNDPVLAWMAPHVVTITKDVGGVALVRLDKASSPEKIDGFAAIVNAMDRVVRRPIQQPFDGMVRNLADFL